MALEYTKIPVYIFHLLKVDYKATKGLLDSKNRMLHLLWFHVLSHGILEVTFALVPWFMIQTVLVAYTAGATM